MIGTRDGLRAYANDRGISPPEIGINERADQALTRATDYIETFYTPRFDAELTVPALTLEYAAYEAAIMELTNKGFFNRYSIPGERKVLVAAKGIQWERVPGKDDSIMPRLERIEALLAPYIKPAVGLYVI